MLGGVATKGLNVALSTICLKIGSFSTHQDRACHRTARPLLSSSSPCPETPFSSAVASVCALPHGPYAPSAHYGLRVLLVRLIVPTCERGPRRIRNCLHRVRARFIRI